MEPLIIAKSGKEDVCLLPSMGSRHGIVCGSDSSGKMITVQKLCERFSEIGTSVFVIDASGDLAGLARPREISKGHARSHLVSSSETPRGYPVVFWDVFGKLGHQVRTTVSALGPLLLSLLLELNERQSETLATAFEFADDNNYYLHDLKDLRALLSLLAEEKEKIASAYGDLSLTAIETIQDRTITIEDHGGNDFLGYPPLDAEDLIRTNSDGSGQINILSCESGTSSNEIYSAFSLLLLSDLLEALPESRGLGKPRIIFFFDQAHLAPLGNSEHMMSSLGEVIHLSGERGIGIFVISERPDRVPETVLGQLGNRVLHRPKITAHLGKKLVGDLPDYEGTKIELWAGGPVAELKRGEALIRFLNGAGQPGPLIRATVLPPNSRVGKITAAERKGVLDRSPFGSKYDTSVDVVSASEMISMARARAVSENPVDQPDNAAKQSGELEVRQLREEYRALKAQQEIQALRAKIAKLEEERLHVADSPARTRRRPKEPLDGMDVLINQATRSAAREVGRQIVRGILGSLKR